MILPGVHVMYGVVSWGAGLNSVATVPSYHTGDTCVRVISAVVGVLARSCTFTTAFDDRKTAAFTPTAVIEVLYRPQVDIFCLQYCSAAENTMPHAMIPDVLCSSTTRSLHESYH